MILREQRILQRSKPYRDNQRLYILATLLIGAIALVLKLKLEGIL